MLIGDFIQIDTWVALLFGAGKPVFLDQSTYGGEGVDPLVHDYLKGLYVLDPFYIEIRARPTTGLIRLSAIAPTYFKDTDYYRLYFTHNVVADEVQFNVKLEDDQVLCLSLGAKHRFRAADLAILELIRPWVIALMRQRLRFEHLYKDAQVEKAPVVAPNEARSTLLNVLTARERDVVSLVLSGHSNKEVAEKLSLSAETVKVHRRNLYRKLNVTSQSELFFLLFAAGEGFHEGPIRAS